MPRGFLFQKSGAHRRKTVLEQLIDFFGAEHGQRPLNRYGGEPVLRPRHPVDKRVQLKVAFAAEAYDLIMGHAAAEPGYENDHDQHVDYQVRTAPVPERQP